MLVAKIKYKLLYTLCPALLSCNLEPPEISNPVTWYAVNGWNSRVTLQIRDRVCNRQLRNITLDIGEEVQITTCGDAENKARIRYRRDSYQMPASTGVASDGQRLQMQ